MIWGWIKSTSRRCFTALPTSASLSTWANIAGGFSTMAAAIVAIWAYFFTDIAQELTRQYNADVAALNEQVIDLRRERRDLDTQVQAAKADKEITQKQLAEAQAAYDADKGKYQASIEVLQADKGRMEKDIAALDRLSSELKAEIAALLSEQRARENELRKAEGALLKSRKDKDTLLVELVARRVGGQLLSAFLEVGEMKDEAATAVDMIAYSTWRIEMDRLLPPDDPGARERVTLRAWSEIMSKMPKSWDPWHNPDFAEPPIEFDELPTTDGKVAFRHRLSKVDRSQLAKDFVATLLKEALGPLPPDDHKRVSKAIEVFFRNHNDLLAQNIMVVVPKTASETEVVANGQKVMRTLDGLWTLLQNMPTEISDLVASIK